MKVSATELAFLRSQGLYITEKCDECRKALNQALRYTISGRPEVYCSAACRDLAFFANRHEAKKRTTPGKCAYCGGSLKGKKRGALYCDDACRKRASRTNTGATTAQAEKSRTPTQSNQEVVDAKTGGKGNRIASDLADAQKRRGGIPREMKQAEYDLKAGKHFSTAEARR